MTEIREALIKKLEQNMKQYTQKLLEFRPELLIGKAAEIAATQFCYEELVEGHCNTSDMQYLLKFENPLEVVRDQWLDEQAVDHSEEFDHVLWTLRDKRDAEEIYELDTSWEPQSGGGQTLC